MVVADLFSRQCKPWQKITRNLVQRIHEAASVTFAKLVSTICDTNTTQRLLAGLIQPSLRALREQLESQVDEFMEPHLSVHPISYNEYLVDFVQEIQAKRHKRKFDRAALTIVKVDTNTVSCGDYDKVALKSLLGTLLCETEPNVREYSASLAADVAAAYYKVTCFADPNCYRQS